MSEAPVHRVPNGRRYCWAEHPRTRVHCTDPQHHKGDHWHAYTRTRW